MAEPVLHLASASPRRREILATLGVAHSWQGVAVDETPRPGETDAALVERLARAKAQAALASRGNGLPILGADTIVSLEGQLFGKARSREETLYMLESLSGRVHRVLTAVAMIAGGRERVATAATEVRMRAIEPAEALAYWRSGECEGKAGAYAIQGLGGMFVSSIAGSYTAVVGLPVFETAMLLKEAGVDVFAGAGARP